MKKIVSILLAFCLLITAAVPAFAVTTKNTPQYETFSFYTKKEFSNWLLEKSEQDNNDLAKEIVNKGYFLSAKTDSEELVFVDYLLTDNDLNNKNGTYNFVFTTNDTSDANAGNRKHFTFSLNPIADEISDLESALKLYLPIQYSLIKDGSLETKKETYKGKELIYWDYKPSKFDGDHSIFPACAFLQSGYFVVVCALYDLREKPWSNEYLDLFEFEKVYIGDEFEKKIADVSANRKIGIEDALLVLQYSIGMIRKFPTHSYNKNYSGCMAPDRIAFYNEYGKKEVTNWFSDLAKEDSLPVMFERLEENGGFPYFSSSNELYKKYYFTFYNYDFTAEYPLIVCEYWDEINLYPFDTAHWSYLFTATFTDKNHDRDLESELASLYFSTYSDVMKYGEFKPGNVDGIDYLYWDGLDDKLSPGFVFEKDGYFIYFKGENPEQNIKDFKIDLIPINENLKDKPIMQRYGDVNRDNKIDASDALRILQYSVGIVDKVLYKEPEPKPEDPDTDIDDWDGVTECIITCRVCNRNQWMRPRDGLPGGWIINDDMSYTCPDCK